MHKERILGSLILLAGGILLLAILFRNDPVENLASNEGQIVSPTNQNTPADTIQQNETPATVDYKTEQRILEQKRAERTARAAEQERLVKEYMALQDKANENALSKAKSEIERAVKSRAEQDAPIVVAKKPKAEPVKKTEQAQKPTTKPVQAKQESTNNTPKDNKAYGVQVAMAGTQAQANKLAAKLKQNGYKVATSQTSRGVRVIVVGGQGKQAAETLKNKVNSDKRVNVNGAWVMNESVAELKARASKSDTKTATTPKPKLESQQKQTQASTTQTSKEQSKDNSTYGVQVAMAGTQALADELAIKLMSAGYKNVKTSATTRGVRVLVGGKLAKDDATQLKNKLNADAKLNVNGAWIKRE